MQAHLAVIEALTAHARQEASPHSVMRALLSHDGWLAPAGWLAHHFPDRKAYPRILRLPDSGEWPPAGRLWLFTDEEEAYAALEAGGALGTYAGPVAGLTLFDALGDDLYDVRVNPAAPLERGWFMDRSSFAYAARWAEALRFEAAIARDYNLHAWLPGYASYLVPVDRETQKAKIVQVDAPSGKYLPAFTAPDRCDVFIYHLEESARSNTVAARMSGAELFGFAATLPVDGVALNVDRRPCVVLPRPVCLDLSERAARLAREAG